MNNLTPFANKCSLIANSSAHPTDYELFTDKSLSNIIFTVNDIGGIVSSLNTTKAHGHDMMSILMLKVCEDSINKSLGLNFRDCLEHGKKPMLFLFIKNDKQSIKNYKPVSLLPICENIFERLLCNNTFYFFN